MNKIKLVILMLLAALGLLGCALGNQEAAPNTYAVLVEDSALFNAKENCLMVEAGEKAEIELTFIGGYEYEGCNYEDCSAQVNGEKVVLTIPSVGHDYRIKVISRAVVEEPIYPESIKTITYYANGGRWTKEGESHTENYLLSYHYRANTSVGVGLANEGYTLIGWNTQADGQGEHVGLGSRTDCEVLYAEWLKWEDSKNFTYRRLENGVAITGYKGAGDTSPLVIPAKLEGLPVVQIDSSFTNNMRCGELTGSTLVLPESLVCIKSGAFTNACFTEIYFFDSLEEVENKAFAKAPSTYHINASMAPVFQQENDNTRFADKVDYLMLQEGKCLVLFGGCATSYGINSSLLKNSYPDYNICNMGVIGGVNAIFQLEIIRNYLKEGDVFIHLPEEMSSYQLMRYISLDYRAFIMVEGNYDLLALADFSYLDTFWENYNSYHKIKAEEKEGSYSDGVITYNQYGDICIGRPYDEAVAWERDISYSDNSYRFSAEVITEEGMDRLCAFYDEFTQAGIKVIIGYAPVNEDGLDGTEAAEEYEQLFRTELENRGYSPIGNLSSHILSGRYFYDSDYHLNDLGAYLNTEILVSELKGGWE